MSTPTGLRTKSILIGLTGFVVSALAASVLIVAPARSDSSSPTRVIGSTGATGTAATTHHGAASRSTGSAMTAAQGGRTGGVTAAASRTPRVGGPNVAIPKTGAERTWQRTPTPALPAGTQTSNISIGPYLVAGGSVGTPGTVPGTQLAGGNAPAVDVGKPCTDCYIVGMKASIVDQSGRVVDLPQKVMLHHIALGREGAGLKDATCDQQLGSIVLGQRFFAAGNELSDVRMPPGAGVYVGRSELWNAAVHLMNWNPDPRMLSVRMTYDWVPRTAAPAGMKSATMLWLDAGACNVFDTFDLPSTGRVASQVASWTSPVNARIITAVGHLHSNGILLTSRNVTTKKTICVSRSREFHAPGWTDGHGLDGVSEMTRCDQKDWSHPVATIRRGDQIRTTAYYNRMNDRADPPEYLMGILLAYMVPQ